MCEVRTKAMRINVITYGERINYGKISANTVIVIDVLRCTSAIVTALDNGAEKVVPVLEPSEAISLAQAIGQRECILGGERGCNRLPGFDAGNSPFEYDSVTVAGKTVIISTTNGTSAICGMRDSAQVFLGAMINRSAVARAAAAFTEDVLIVCSGTDGVVSADDYCAAGSVIDALLRYVPGADVADIGLICLNLYESFKRGQFDLMATRHCRRLAELGYKRDVEYCLTEDSSSLVPVYANGIITPL